MAKKTPKVPNDPTTETDIALQVVRLMARVAKLEEELAAVLEWIERGEAAIAKLADKAGIAAWTQPEERPRRVTEKMRVVARGERCSECERVDKKGDIEVSIRADGRKTCAPCWMEILAGLPDCARPCGHSADYGEELGHCQLCPESDLHVYARAGAPAPVIGSKGRQMWKVFTERSPDCTFVQATDAGGAKDAAERAGFGVARLAIPVTRLAPEERRPETTAAEITLADPPVAPAAATPATPARRIARFRVSFDLDVDVAKVLARFGHETPDGSADARVDAAELAAMVEKLAGDRWDAGGDSDDAAFVDATMFQAAFAEDVES